MKIYPKKIFQSKTGSTFVFSLVITSVFLTFGAGYLGLLLSEVRNTQKTHRSNVALHLAEAGIEEALWEFIYNNANFSASDNWTGTNPKIKTASLATSAGETLGQYTVTVTDPTGSTSIIEGAGRALYQASQAELRTVQVTLTQSPAPSFTMAAFAQENITLDSNACTDSFDSRNGPYDRRNNSGEEGDIGTNSTANNAITLDSNANVDGDASVGTGGDPETGISLASNATITGTQDDLSAAVELPSITGPTGLTDRGSVTYDDDDSHTITSSGQYTNLIVDGNTSLTISGDVQLYVTGTFKLDSNSDLYIASGSDVEIYVDGQIYFASNSTVNNNTEDPSKLKLYGTDSLVDDGSDAGIRFNSNTDIYAQVFAKNSTIDLDSNAHVFGGVIADKINLNSNTCIHYDVALGSGSSSGSSRFSISSWLEK